MQGFKKKSGCKKKGIWKKKIRKISKFKNQMLSSLKEMKMMKKIYKFSSIRRRLEKPTPSSSKTSLMTYYNKSRF